MAKKLLAMVLGLTMMIGAAGELMSLDRQRRSMLSRKDRLMQMQRLRFS